MEKYILTRYLIIFADKAASQSSRERNVTLLPEYQLSWVNLSQKGDTLLHWILFEIRYFIFSGEFHQLINKWKDTFSPDILSFSRIRRHPVHQSSRKRKMSPFLPEYQLSWVNPWVNSSRGGGGGKGRKRGKNQGVSQDSK